MPDESELPVVVHRAGGVEPPTPAFYLDLASPECLLVCERILSVMPVPVEWIPVHLQPPPLTDDERAAMEALVAERELQPLRWPPPFDAEFANLTATYAKSIGRSVAFAQAAFRQAYAGGRDLSVPDHVLIAASACEMHPTAILKTVETKGPRRALETATALARRRGVTSTPAFWVPSADRVLHGDAALESAAALLAEHTT